MSKQDEDVDQRAAQLAQVRVEIEAMYPKVLERDIVAYVRDIEKLEAEKRVLASAIDPDAMGSLLAQLARLEAQLAELEAQVKQLREALADVALCASVEHVLPDELAAAVSRLIKETKPDGE